MWLDLEVVSLGPANFHSKLESAFCAQIQRNSRPDKPAFLLHKKKTRYRPAQRATPEHFAPPASDRAAASAAASTRTRASTSVVPLRAHDAVGPAARSPRTTLRQLLLLAGEEVGVGRGGRLAT